MRNINPDSLYWASFNRFEMRLPGQAVLDCAHSGDCEEDCKHWAPKIKQQVEDDNFKLRPTDENIKLELKEYGAWSPEELEDEEMNWVRLVWIAANNIKEGVADCSEPLE